jgi:tetratricopeptide (TPR) repeat protein
MALYRTGKPEPALKAYDKALKLTDREGDQAMINFNRATVLMQMERWEDACKVLESLSVMPAENRGKLSEQSVLYNLGYCYRRRKMIKMARSTYERLNDIDPSYKDVALCVKRLRVPLAASVPDNESGSTTCGECGKPLPLGATFCSHCGWSSASAGMTQMGAPG